MLLRLSRSALGFWTSYGVIQEGKFRFNFVFIRHQQFTLVICSSTLSEGLFQNLIVIKIKFVSWPE